MTIKTPEQVARETLGADALAGIGYEKYVPYMVAAIEADRAQRSTRLAGVTVHSVELGDPSLRCDDCGEELCTVEEADMVVTLADVALTHGDTACAPRSMCENCDDRIEPDDMHADDDLCGSCNHNAARSGA